MGFEIQKMADPIKKGLSTISRKPLLLVGGIGLIAAGVLFFKRGSAASGDITGTDTGSVPVGSGINEGQIMANVREMIGQNNEDLTDQFNDSLLEMLKQTDDIISTTTEDLTKLIADTNTSLIGLIDQNAAGMADFSGLISDQISLITDQIRQQNQSLNYAIDDLRDDINRNQQTTKSSGSTGSSGGSQSKTSGSAVWDGEKYVYSNGYVKMWDGNTFVTVNPKYVDEYKGKGMTTDLPTDAEIRKMIS